MASKSFKTTLLLTVLVTPLLIATPNYGFEHLKVIFFIILTSISAVCWLIQKPKIYWTRLKIISGFFILTLSGTSIFGVNPEISFIGGPPYFQGAILYSYLYLFFLMVSQTKIKFSVWSYLFFASSFAISLIALKDFIALNILHIPTWNYAGRVVSTFGQPNLYSGFLVITLPFFWFQFLNSTPKFQNLKVLGLLTIILAILASLSRGAIILLGFFLLYWLLEKTKVSLRKTMAIILTLLLISILTSFFTKSGFFYDEFALALSVKRIELINQPLEKRAYIWPATFELFLKSPLIGYGLESISTVFPNYIATGEKPQPFFIIKYLYLDRTHNYPLDLLFFSGISGFLAWLVLVITALKSSKDKTILLSLALYLIWIQFQVQSVVHLIFFWFLIALIDNQNKITDT